MSPHYDPHHGRVHDGGLGDGFAAVCRFLYRFHLGRPILRFAGQRPTDATFFRRGTKPRSEWDRLTFWAYLPEGVRAAIRIWSCEVLPFLAVKWWWTGSWVYATATIAGVAGSMAALGWLGWRQIRHWRHKRRYVRPALGAVNDVLRQQLPESALKVPLNFRDRETKGVVLDLPPDRFIDLPLQNTLTSCLSQRLGLPSPKSTVRGSGHKLTLVLTPAPEPPSTVRFCDLRPHMDACAPGEIVLGIDANEKVFKRSFKKGDPHWGFSVNTQRGKSTMAQNVTAQVLHQDIRNEVTYIDPKVKSCEPLWGTPGLILANNPGDVLGMWRAIENVRKTVEYRRDTQLIDASEFGMHLLVLDELNEFAASSRIEWMLKRKDEQVLAEHPEWENWPKAGPSPVWRDLSVIIRQGAQFGVHVMFFGQRLDEAACGGIGLRSQLGLLGLSGYRPSWWRSLVGTSPVPPPQEGQGRWIYSAAGVEIWVQNVYASSGSTDEERAACWEQEIRDYAQHGRKHVRPVVVPGEVVEEPDPVHVEAERLYTAAEVSSDRGQGIVPMTLTAITTAKSRAKARDGVEWPKTMTAEQWQVRLRKFEVVTGGRESEVSVG
ncbi:MAG: hypothetical protein M3460_04620 [Actinomycetota bacterium]|nr:hypothetical protein [Actinomycetota bacterium]